MQTDKAFVLVALIAMAATFSWRAGWLARRTVAGRENALKLEAALVMPVRLFLFACTPTLLGAIMVNQYEAHPLEMNDIDWGIVGRTLIGCALLMEVISRCAGDERALQEPIPDLVGLRAVRGAMVGAAGRFFWAAVGAAALFGGEADREVASVLAFDFGLLGAMFALGYLVRKRRWERERLGFSGALDPRPDGAPNMTDLTRSFPANREKTLRAHDGGRIVFGERIYPAAPSIAQGAIVCVTVAIVALLVVAGQAGGAIGTVVVGAILIALAEREKRRPPYRVEIDTDAGVARVTLPRFDTPTEMVPLADAYLRVVKSGDDGESTWSQLVLVVPETYERGHGTKGSRPLVLLDWVPHRKALEAAHALVAFTGLPLEA